MKTMTRLVLVCALYGCGGGGGGSVALTDFGTRAAEVYCAKAFACCTADERMNELAGQYPDEATCRTQLAALFGMFGTSYQASIDSGRMEYDGEKAGACFDAAEAMACAEFFASEGFGADCDDPFVGKQADGMPCANDEECVSNYCEGDSIQPAMEGTCKAMPGMGAQCPDFQCADGLYCEFSGMGQSCQPRKADGMPCDFGDECASGGCNGADPMGGTPGTCGAPTTCDGV